MGVTIRKYAAQYMVSPEVLSYETANAFMADLIIHRLVRQVATIEGNPVLRVPDGTWQMFKSRHPHLLGRCRPVRYHEYLAVAYLPDLPLPTKPGWRHVLHWEDRGIPWQDGDDD